MSNPTTCASRRLFIGFDLSLKSTGLARLEVDGTRLVSVKFARLAPPDSVRGAARLHFLNSKLDAVLDEWFTAPPGLADYHIEAAIESYAYGTQGTLASTAEWGGIVRLALYVRGISCAEVTPATLKLKFAGHGHANKQVVVDMVYAHMRQAGLSVVSGRTLTNDETDAFALAWLRWKGEHLPARARKGPEKRPAAPRRRQILTETGLKTGAKA